MLNKQIDSALNRQEHMDLMIMADVGFPCTGRLELISLN